MIKTFRGLLADGGQDRIRLGTNKGKVGYKIIKFQTFPTEPGEQNIESTAKIYKVKQTTVDNTVDFADNTLLAAAYYQDGTDVNLAGSESVIFDNEIFNQDIYITAFDSASDQKTNYYIELEVIPLTDHAAEYTTIKDIRSNS